MHKTNEMITLLIILAGVFLLLPFMVMIITTILSSDRRIMAELSYKDRYFINKSFKYSTRVLMVSITITIITLLIICSK